MLEYQRQNSTQTLREGIDEYFAANEEHFGDREMTPEATEFFRCHDVAHVVFGCDTSLDDELVVKISSIFGTTAGLDVMKGYRLAESREVYHELKFLDMLVTALLSFVIIPRTIWVCLRMKKRWVWDTYDEYLSTTLSEVRQAFGIRVVHSQVKKREPEGSRKNQM